MQILTVLILVNGGPVVFLMALIVNSLLWILQVHSFTPPLPPVGLYSAIKQALYMAKSNAGLVPTNMLLACGVLPE